METEEFDVVVIGTGFGAAPPALRLAQAGARVLMLEKGPRLRPTGDFRQTQDPRYLRRFIKSVSASTVGLTYAEALGGGSAFYEMVSLRAPSKAFDQREAGGRRLWPERLDRRAMDPWYDLADRTLGVEQIAVDDVPKTGQVFSLLMRNLGFSCDRARYAVRHCVGAGSCVTGCPVGAKRWLMTNYLPAAEEAGARIETDLEAVAVGVLRHPRRYQVLARGREGGWRHVNARTVILAGGTVGTARLLLRSRPQLPRLSPRVGKHIALNGGVKAAGILADGLPDGDMFSGRSHPGVISYQFMESHGISVFPAKPLPLQLISSARIRLEGDDRQPVYWGEPHVELMRLYRRRMMILVALGLTPPAASVELDGDGKLVASMPIDAGLRAYDAEVSALLDSILTRNGCRPIRADFVDGSGAPYTDLRVGTAHQTGSCRMADGAEHGVCDARGEVFGYPGLYVTDAAAIPTSLAVNTSLTVVANAERIAAGIIEHGA